MIENDSELKSIFCDLNENEGNFESFQMSDYEWKDFSVFSFFTLCLIRKKWSHEMSLKEND